MQFRNSWSRSEVEKSYDMAAHSLIIIRKITIIKLSMVFMYSQDLNWYTWEWKFIYVFKTQQLARDEIKFVFHNCSLKKLQSCYKDILLSYVTI